MTTEGSERGGSLVEEQTNKEQTAESSETTETTGKTETTETTETTGTTERIRKDGEGGGRRMDTGTGTGVG